MWPLKTTLALLSVLVPLVSFAANALAPAKKFTVFIHGKYADRWLKIYQDHGKWICEANEFPYFEAKGNPLRDLNWKKLEAESKRATPGCRDQVTLTDDLGRQSKKITSCLDLPRIKHWADEISQRCGRL
jgi:hypothetical protein